jgi:hypothetical protein
MNGAARVSQLATQEEMWRGHWMQTQRFACAGNPWGSGVRFFLALWGRKLEESIQSASAILLGVLSTLPAANLFLESTSDTRGT